MAEADIGSVELTGNKPHPSTEAQPEPAPPTPEPAVPELAPVDGDPAPPDAAAPVDGDPKPAPRANAFQARIDKLTKDKYDRERENAALKIENERLKASQKPADPDPAAPEPVTSATARQPDVDTLVNQRAQALYQQRIHQERVNTVLSAGNGEFKDFTDRCNVVANLGGADRPDFMEIVTDPSIVPDGHKIIAALADNPDEAARILSLPTIAMSAELARYAERVGKPPVKAAAISKVPAPIKPLNGVATVSDEPSPNDSEDEWFAKREAQRAQRQQVARSL